MSAATIKARSPNYPYIDLEKASQLAKKLFLKVAKNHVDSIVAGKEMGYSGTSGSTLKIIAAMKAYGLINEIKSEGGRRIAISELGLPIVADGNLEARQNALKKAALNPKLFSHIWQTYTHPFPSEDAIIYDLMVGEFTSQEAASSAVKNFNHSIKYAGLIKEASDEIQSSKENYVISESAQNEQQIDKNDSLEESNNLYKSSEQYTNNNKGGIIEVSTTIQAGYVKLTLPAKMTNRDLEDLEDWFDYVKKKINRLCSKEE